MSYKTQMRLYLLNLALNPCDSADCDDLLTVSTWISPSIMVSRLQELGWVSRLYDLRNLRLDYWYLRRRSACPPPELNSYTNDPSSILLFRIIFQALKDLQCGRPCDLGIWVADEPPDYRRCLASEHICYQNAERYLNELGDVECLINLSPQFLSGLVINIKKDPIFRI
jgi:hypothetical protein